MISISATCPEDVVIDTCVLSHSCNRGIMQHASALAVLQWLMGQPEVKWVLDDHGKSAPNTATSLLYSEYHSTLPPQSFPLILLANFLSFGRVAFAPKPGQDLRTQLRSMVPRNKMDQAVLGAAAGSRNKILISNDEDDFSTDVRESSEQEFGVRIICSFELEM